MAKAKIVFVDRGEKASVYTITFEGESLSEFGKFIEKFNDDEVLKRDFQAIISAIQNIMNRGALERYFRPEGKFADGVCALPIEHGKLRLYCVRVSDKILVAGNGGIKNVRSYEESEELNGYVMNLQRFDSQFKVAIRKGSVIVEEMVIKDTDNKYFEL